MSISTTRLRAVIRKELRDFRRNRFIVVTMTLTPAVFVILPIVSVFTIPSTVSSSVLTTRIGLLLLYLLMIPAITPAATAAYAVVGEREQGTLEPVLTTPIRREELLIGKALATLLPTLLVSYAVFGVFLGIAALFAHPAVASAIFHGPQLIVQLVFTPLLAGWSIWAAIAISTRASDVRVAQQLATLASLPPLAVTSLLSFNVIRPTLTLTLCLAGALLLIDVLGWRIVSVLFDRERLVTGHRA